MARTDGAAWRMQTGPGLFAAGGRSRRRRGRDDPDRAADGRAALGIEPEERRRVERRNDQGRPEAVEELRRCIATATG